jgi:hypothetical protein
MSSFGEIFLKVILLLCLGIIGAYILTMDTADVKWWHAVLWLTASVVIMSPWDVRSG